MLGWRLVVTSLAKLLPAFAATVTAVHGHTHQVYSLTESQTGWPMCFILSFHD